MTARILHGARCAGAVALALMLAACQPLPQPFQHKEDLAINPLTVLKDGAGVALRPIEGIDLLLSDEITTEVVQALAAEDVPASAVTENSASFRLRASGAVTALTGGQRDLTLDWRLSDAADESLDEQQQRLRLPPGTAHKPALQRLAQELVARLMPKLTDPAPRSEQAEAVEVRPIEGAPGDGATGLQRALEYVLSRNGIAVVQSAEQRRGVKLLVVRGKVEMGRAEGGTQSIAIRWSLLGPDGAELGSVTQANKVPAGSLDRSWGDTAFIVAQAAFDGIGALLQQIWGPGSVKPTAMP